MTNDLLTQSMNLWKELEKEIRVKKWRVQVNRIYWYSIFSLTDFSPHLFSSDRVRLWNQHLSLVRKEACLFYPSLIDRIFLDHRPSRLSYNEKRRWIHPSGIWSNLCNLFSLHGLTRALALAADYHRLYPRLQVLMVIDLPRSVWIHESWLMVVPLLQLDCSLSVLD